MVQSLSFIAAAAIASLLAAVVVLIRARNMQYWLRSYWFPERRVLPAARLNTPDADEEPRVVFIAICDHFEPEWGRPPKAVAFNRVERWREEYPRLFSHFQDSRGQLPQHSFFFPQDEYAPEYIEALADLCRAGYGDVDVHLHHDNDTAESLTEKLESFRDDLFYRHGMLRRDPQTGQIVYGFIHGNWALCNSRPDGRWCGVNDEIKILLETGCYADFTMPSAPSNTQTRTINSIYYAVDRPGHTKSHDCGTLARVGMQPAEDNLLMVQGPLLLDWQRRKWGIIPRIENSDIHAGRPPSWSRMQLWLKAGIQVLGRPDWLFVKLHTHGCKDGNIDTLLGPQTQQFHQELNQYALTHPNFRYYYVSAWQMAQLIHQAENGTDQPEFSSETAELTQTI